MSGHLAFRVAFRVAYRAPYRAGPGRADQHYVLPVNRLACYCSSRVAWARSLFMICLS